MPSFKARISAAALAALLAASPAAFCAEGNAAASAEAPEYALDRTTLIMGTIVRTRVIGKTPEDAKRYAKIAEERLEHFDDTLSVHKKTALNDVNLRSGETVEVPCEAAGLAKESFAAADLTDGAFEPMIGPVVNLWKIGFGGEHVPSDEAIRDAVSKVDRSKVAIDDTPPVCSIRIAKGQFMDLGGSAKGYIGTSMADSLKAAGMTHGLLDLGGNVVAIGQREPGVPWKVGIQHPAEERGGYYAVVEASDESVITSGAYERYFEENGKRYSHILDPKTGRPVKTDISSVTIIDRDGTRADALCTALFSMGWERACAFLRAHPDLRAVLLHADMKRAAVTKSAEKSVKLQPGFEETVL
jgi:thiamine biosynthesis lipoprotein